MHEVLGRTKVHWRDGFRRMIEARHPDLVLSDEHSVETANVAAEIGTCGDEPSEASELLARSESPRRRYPAPQRATHDQGR